MVKMSEELRKTIRRYLTEVPMSPDPHSEYGLLASAIQILCDSEGISVQDVLNEVAEEWRAPQ